jgi:hypothetical protein
MRRDAATTFELHDLIDKQMRTGRQFDSAPAGGLAGAQELFAAPAIAQATQTSPISIMVSAI